MPDHSTRRLAAILFADIAGYTSLMQHDEQVALQKLTRFKEILQAKIAEFQGNIIQYYGDGCLVVFDSPVAAVACAKALQLKFQQAPTVPVRIGLHLGDVVFKEGNAFGDSVNIANRIESLGVAGAVLLSQTVRRQIKNQPEFQLASLGSFEFKNVDEPMEVFALANDGFPVPNRAEMEGKLKAPALARATYSTVWKKAALAATVLLLAFSGWFFFKKMTAAIAATDANFDKSIAVLPFRNNSPASENQFFCDGVMEAVLNHLSKIEGLKVISRTSMERYRDTQKSIAEIAGELNVANILEGSVQRQGGQVRINVQLVTAESERQIWANTYDRELTDIFSIQSEIAQSIAGQLKIELSPQAKTALAMQPTTNLKSYDYYLKGREQLVKYFTDLRELLYQNARQNFEKALEADSLLAPAWADFASLIWIRGYSHADRPTKAGLDSVRILCEKALAIDPYLPQAHAVLGNYYLRLKDEKRFVEEQWKALASDANYAGAYRNLGAYYADSKKGEYEKGIRMLKKAIQLDPLSAWTADYYLSLVEAYLNINAFEEAEDYGRKVNELGDFSWWNSLVHIYLVQGKYAEAEALANVWRAKSPEALRYLSEIEVNYHQNYKKAIEYYKEFEKLHPDLLNFRQRFGLAYWLDGQKEKGKTLMLEAVREYEKENELSNYGHCYDYAGIYATLGETQKALSILKDKACTLEVGLDYYITIDPLFQNLWSNAEFQQIVRERQAEKAKIREAVRKADLKG